ncbi:hypothetical protein CsSME_00049159 [Camellia sinensis var. sinensis]
MSKRNVISEKDKEQFGFPDIFYRDVDHFGWGMHYCPSSCPFLLISHRSCNQLSCSVNFYGWCKEGRAS